MKGCGIIYGAFDPLSSPAKQKFNPNKKRILNEFMHSFCSLRNHNPTLPITVFTDYQELLDKKFDGADIIYQKNDVGLLPKVECISRSPYDKTFFIDTDTEIKGDISELFDFLNYNNFACAREFIHPTAYNTGVLGFNTCLANTSVFINHWFDSVKKLKAKGIEKICDQGAFNNLLRFKHKKAKPKFKNLKECVDNVSIFELDSKIYNLRYGELKTNESLFKNCKILHIRGLAK